VLWNAGDVDFCFFVILSGGAVIRNTVGEAVQVAYHGPGEFTGDVDVMSGRPAPVGGYADGETKVLQLSAEDLRDLVRIEQNLGGKILSAFIRRREILLDSTEHGALIIGSQYDPATMALRTFLGRNRVVHRWRQPEDPATAEILTAFGLNRSDTPLVILGNERLTHPTVDELGTKLGIRRDTNKGQYDLVIIGAGPAGLAAAVYGASEGLHTLLLDRSGPGGQASWSSRIENYMGFPEGLTGSDLAARGLIQAQKFGADMSFPVEVCKIDCSPQGQQVHLATGETIDARAVLVSSGATYQKLNIPGFGKFEATCVYYAATRLEAQFCANAEVVVVGAGNSAGQAAVFLSQTAKKVHLIVRGDRLNKSMSDYLSYRVESLPKIEVHLQTEVAELVGESRVQEAILKGGTSGSIPCDGLFVFIGANPNTAFLKDTVALDRKGFVLTGDAMRAYWDIDRMPYYLESSCPGIFAAGDCRVGSVKRVASSVGEGSMAVTFIHRYLEGP
jgi:thioredoxin reductase (NADPH)